MSSSILDNQIYHSILFPHEFLHPLSLKVFRSRCFVHNFSPNLDKLSLRSHKCILLGFTRSQKGYKCFSTSLNRYFVLAYVIFNDSSFYFKSHSSPCVSLFVTTIIPIIMILLLGLMHIYIFHLHIMTPF